MKDNMLIDLSYENITKCEIHGTEILINNVLQNSSAIYIGKRVFDSQIPPLARSIAVKILKNATFGDLLESGIILESYDFHMRQAILPNSNLKILKGAEDVIFQRNSPIVKINATLNTRIAPFEIIFLEEIWIKDRYIMHFIYVLIAIVVILWVYIWVILPDPVITPKPQPVKPVAPAKPALLVILINFGRLIVEIFDHLTDFYTAYFIMHGFIWTSVLTTAGFLIPIQFFFCVVLVQSFDKNITFKDQIAVILLYFGYNYQNTYNKNSIIKWRNFIFINVEYIPQFLSIFLDIYYIGMTLTLIPTLSLISSWTIMQLSLISLLHYIYKEWQEIEQCRNSHFFKWICKSMFDEFRIIWTTFMVIFFIVYFVLVILLFYTILLAMADSQDILVDYQFIDVEYHGGSTVFAISVTWAFFGIIVIALIVIYSKGNLKTPSTKEKTSSTTQTNKAVQITKISPNTKKDAKVMVVQKSKEEVQKEAGFIQQSEEIADEGIDSFLVGNQALQQCSTTQNLQQQQNQFQFRYLKFQILKSNKQIRKIKLCLYSMLLLQKRMEDNSQFWLNMLQKM